MNLDKIKNIDTAIKEAKLLAAEPYMLDPNFKRSVILMCDHHPEGSVGFIINKPIEMKLNELLMNFPTFEADVYYGGPVSTDTIHYIHRLGDLLPESVEIAQGIYWGGDFDQLKALARMDLLTNDDIRFFVGYSGWSSGQLVEEIEAHSWILAHLDPNYIFQEKIQGNDLWSKVLRNEGNTYSVISQIPDGLAWN